jgi:hypothetical protein
MPIESKSMLLLALIASSMCSLLYGGVLVSSLDPVVDFVVDTNHLAIMYGNTPANITAKRIDVYNTSTNLITTVASNITIVYTTYLSGRISFPVQKIRSSMGRNTAAAYEYFI